MHIVNADKAQPIVPRSRIKGIIERVDCKGEVIIPLQEDSVRRAVTELYQQGVAGIAVGFLWSFLNPVHEISVKNIINEMYPDLPVAISSEVAPVVREYPRFMSTMLDLHIGTALSKLFLRIKNDLATKGYKRPLLIMQAAGGVARSEIVRPAATLHSGPVGGLAGVEFLKELYNYDNAIGSDIGGTSFDICISPKEGSPLLREPIVGRFQIATPMKEIVTIGAGGGSIAWYDEVTKILKVGPKSAGSDPGPVCYDTGGTLPTVTDADVVLNRVDPDYFLGGTKKLNRDKAWQAIKEHVAEPLGMDVPEAAEAICKIIDGTMQATLHSTIAIRGLDPEKFVCVAYGGAGPVHCAGYTSGLGFNKVIIPPFASVFSAFGASTAGVIHRYEASPLAQFKDLAYDNVNLKFNLDELTSLEDLGMESLTRINNMWKRLIAMSNDDIAAEGFDKDQNKIILNYEMMARYGGQLWELRIPLNKAEISSLEDFKEMLVTFEDKYRETYGENAMFPAGGIEIVSIALEARVPLWKPKLEKKAGSDTSPAAALKIERDVYFDGKWVKTPIYEMSKLDTGNIVPGPAIVEGRDTTLVIPSDRQVAIDEYGMLVMTDK